MALEGFNSSPSPAKRAFGALVIALHAGAIYGFTHWKMDRAQPVKVAPLQVAVIAEEQTESRDVLPPPPTIVPQVVMVDMPEINIPEPVQQQAITVAYKSSPAPAPSAAAAPEPKLVSAVEYLRQPKPRYPQVSRRLREEGMVVLRVLINELGQAIRIDLHRSSGHDRLDRAAREAVECAKFKPYTEGGVAQPALVLVPIEFTLNQRVAQR